MAMFSEDFPTGIGSVGKAYPFERALALAA